MTLPSWIEGIEKRILGFLSTIEKDDTPGRFLPCVNGATPKGLKAALGFSCFALKLYHMLGQWEKLHENRRNEWIRFINSFQNTGDNVPENSPLKNAYIDSTIINYLERKNKRLSFLKPFKNIMYSKQTNSHLNLAEKTIIAETKQALSTLAEIGERSIEPYAWYPKTSEEVTSYMNAFDWNQPWGAGGQTAALSVFYSLEASRILPSSQVKELQTTTKRFYKLIADPKTGGYFKGPVPDHGMLINGAMKVLTALDWLQESIHYPEQLIDTCLSKLPKADGCHVVDAVYVLYRCSLQTNYNQDMIIDYCLSLLEMINAHHNHDGGFSYSIRSAQTNYYGVPISKGLDESDIHGTILLTWALTLIFRMLKVDKYQWKTIRP